MIDTDAFQLCTQENCSYTLKIKSKGVKVFNIQGKASPKIETLSYLTDGEQYERTFKKDIVRYFKLPYIDLVEGLDFSVTLRPSTNGTGLYVNPQTKPLNLDSFQWTEKGHLAKRITVRWEELKQMQASKQDIYIAVSQ